MRSEHKYHWLTIVNRRGLEEDWDPDLLIPLDMDESTFVIEVRKTPLRFAIQESPIHPDQYMISYVEYPPGDPSARSTRRSTPGSSLQAEDVDDKLEDWLLHAVAKYVSEHNPDD